MYLGEDQTKAMDIGAVDKLTDDMAELQDERGSWMLIAHGAISRKTALLRMKAINEALAQGSMVPDGATDDELANDTLSQGDRYAWKWSKYGELSDSLCFKEFAKLEEDMPVALAGQSDIP